MTTVSGPQTPLPQAHALAHEPCLPQPQPHTFFCYKGKHFKQVFKIISHECLRLPLITKHTFSQNNFTHLLFAPL